MHTHAGSAFDNLVNFDLLTSWSIHAKRLSCTLEIPCLVSITQVVFSFIARTRTEADTLPYLRNGYRRREWSEKVKTTLPHKECWDDDLP